MKTLVAYREGTLPPAEREAVQEHLSLCSRCTRLLLELRDFEAAVARVARGEADAEPRREEAWEELARRLPARGSGVPAIQPAVRRRAWRMPRAALGAAAAALLTVVAGPALWLARSERRPPAVEHGPALAPLQVSLAEAERRRGAGAGSWAIGDGQVAVVPWFLRRGAADEGGELLRAGGVVNRVRTEPAARRFTVALSLTGHPACPQYRLGLADRDGAVLWVGRWPARSVLGGDGTSVSIAGLGAGLYRLRIEGLHPERADLLAEYLLEVEPG